MAHANMHARVDTHTDTLCLPDIKTDRECSNNSSLLVNDRSTVPEFPPTVGIWDSLSSCNL